MPSPVRILNVTYTPYFIFFCKLRSCMVFACVRASSYYFSFCCCLLPGWFGLLWASARAECVCVFFCFALLVLLILFCPLEVSSPAPSAQVCGLCCSMCINGGSLFFFFSLFFFLSFLQHMLLHTARTDRDLLDHLDPSVRS